MPLPLIPLIILGATAASTALAGKKGYDSVKNMKETKQLAEELGTSYNEVYEEFKRVRDETNEEFEEYGLLKLEILDGSMKWFVETFRQIKHVNFTDEAVTDEFVSNSEIEQFVLTIERQVVKAGQVLAAGVASLAGGGLAAMGALGATTTFAVASTGTAIAALSGIAAQNATLAFLGGGSLAAGGLGVAGGTLVLGGIALAPALAIGSLIFAASTENKLQEMYGKQAEVQAEIEKLHAATNAMEQITSTTASMRDLAKSTDQLLSATIHKMSEIIQSKGVDFCGYKMDEKTAIHNSYKLAVIMRDILNTTILDEQGELIPHIHSVITANKKKISTVQEG